MTAEQLLLPLPGPLMGPAAAPPKPDESPDRRRTRRQREAVTNGVHPLTVSLSGPLGLHRQAAEQGRTCGNCRFRDLIQGPSASAHPKCLVERGPHSRTTAYDCPYPRVSFGSGTDVRKWWPACPDHEWGDNGLSPDAARSGPADVNADE